MSTVTIVEESTSVTEIEIEKIILEEDKIVEVLEVPASSEIIASIDTNTEFLLSDTKTIISFQEPVPEVIEVSCPGPQGPEGPPGTIGNLPSTSLLIEPGSSELGDSLNLLLYSGVTWIITARDIASSAIRMFTVSASFNGVSANHITYGFNGASFGVPITVDYVGNTLELNISNNHTSNLQLNILKLTIGL